MSTTAMLQPHPHAALEYWFFKVNAEPVALLVDWIARRRTHEHWLRVSIHSPGQRAVLFDKQASPMSQGQNFLTADRTAGQLGEVAWELDIELGTEWIDPNIFPVSLLRITDLSLVSAPLVVIYGLGALWRPTGRSAARTGNDLALLGATIIARVVVGIGQSI